MDAIFSLTFHITFVAATAATAITRIMVDNFKLQLCLQSSG